MKTVRVTSRLQELPEDQKWKVVREHECIDFPEVNNWEVVTVSLPTRKRGELHGEFDSLISPSSSRLSDFC